MQILRIPSPRTLKTKTMKDLTVLIPVYNTKPDHLLEAVFSMINQNINKHYKILLVDDGSKDVDTLAMLNYLANNKRGFCEVDVHFMDRNGGTSAALNKGHELVSTEYIAVMGSDDITDKSRLVLQMEYLEKHPEIDVLGTQLFSFYNDDIRRTVVWTSSHPERPNTNVGDSSTLFLVNHGTVIYKNQAVKDVGGYDLGYTRGQDARLWRNMAAAGKTFANLQQVLYAWRRFR